MMSEHPPVVADAWGRPLLASEDRARIREAFQGVVGRGALVWIVHPITKETRGHVAARIGETWKVAAGGGFRWEGKKADAWFGIEKVW